jgi:hypothetical protein
MPFPIRPVNPPVRFDVYGERQVLCGAFLRDISIKLHQFLDSILNSRIRVEVQGMKIQEIRIRAVATGLEIESFRCNKDVLFHFYTFLSNNPGPLFPPAKKMSRFNEKRRLGRPLHKGQIEQCLYDGTKFSLLREGKEVNQRYPSQPINTS